jgi:hypothetical protein
MASGNCGVASPLRLHCPRYSPSSRWGFSVLELFRSLMQLSAPYCSVKARRPEALARFRRHHSVLQIRLPSLPETKMRPSSQNGTQLFSELHVWSKAHCCAPLHSTQTQLLLLHAPVDPHWASVTQSRQWWLTHERPDGQDASVVHLTFSQCPPTQPPRVQSLSALHDGLWHDPLMHRASDWCTPSRHYSSLADSGRTRMPRRRRCNWSRRYMSIALGRRRGRSP